MKRIIAATALSLALMGTSALAQDYSEEQCVADVSALDTNGDGFVDGTEMPTFNDIKSDVDTDNDGKISGDEMTVVCKDDTLRDLLKPVR